MPTESVASTALVATLMDAAFNRPRDPRSAEYQAGVRAGLALRICGTPAVHQHTPGSAQHDAFYSGIDEARAIWRDHQEKEARARYNRARQEKYDAADAAGATADNTQPDGA
ncbi:MAG: hypothetical protein H7Z39_16385 [Burkholderiaceae bacterium]|nr:hypothetical protein [Burkholderiaceae bacterium]